MPLLRFPHSACVGQLEDCEDAEAFLEWLTGAGNKAAEYVGKLRVQGAGDGSWSEAVNVSPGKHDLGMQDPFTVHP